MARTRSTIRTIPRTAVILSTGGMIISRRSWARTSASVSLRTNQCLRVRSRNRVKPLYLEKSEVNRRNRAIHPPTGIFTWTFWRTSATTSPKSNKVAIQLCPGILKAEVRIMPLPMGTSVFSDSAGPLTRWTFGQRKRNGELTEPQCSSNRNEAFPIEFSAGREFQLSIGPLYFVPITAVVSKDGGGVGCLFQQEPGGLFHIVERKYNVFTINR